MEDGVSIEFPAEKPLGGAVAQPEERRPGFGEEDSVEKSLRHVEHRDQAEKDDKLGHHVKVVARIDRRGRLGQSRRECLFYPKEKARFLLWWIYFSNLGLFQWNETNRFQW